MKGPYRCRVNGSRGAEAGGDLDQSVRDTMVADKRKEVKTSELWHGEWCFSRNQGHQ